MNHLNSVLLEGIVTNDPKVVLTSSTTNSKLVKFTLASDRFYYDVDHKLQTSTLFIGVEAWGRLGDQVLENLKKGVLARAVGRLRPVKYVRKSDEVPVDTFEIYAQHIEYKKLSKKKGNDEVPPEELVTLDGDLEECVEEPTLIYDYS